MELTKHCLINNFNFVAYSMIKNNSFDQFVFAIHQFLNTKLSNNCYSNYQFALRQCKVFSKSIIQKIINMKPAKWLLFSCNFKANLYSGITQLVPKPQKCAKRRKKASKGDFMAEKGARMAPKGVKRRILASFDAFWRIGKKHSVL